MNSVNLVNIGFRNVASAARIVAVISPESAPVKRVVQTAKESGNLIDATYGRRSRAVLIMDSGHVILSSIQPETIAARVSRSDQFEEPTEV